MTRFFDWWFSDPVGRPGEPFSFRTLPKWPGWLCRSLTEHDVCLKWADYLNDVAGIRCRCGLIDRDRLKNPPAAANVESTAGPVDNRPAAPPSE
jgi:hypothetical protein